MKYFLVALISLFFFSASTALASADTIAANYPVPSAHCLSSKPCTSGTPSNAVPSTVPSNTAVSGQPGSSSSPAPAAPSANPSPGATSPCATSLSAVSSQSTGGVHAMHEHDHGKQHPPVKNGLIRQLILSLLKLLLLLLQQIGIQVPATIPCIPAAPSGAPSPSAGGGGGGVSAAPSTAPSTGPVPTIYGTSPAPSTAPSSAAGGGSSPGTGGSGTGLSVSGVSVMKGSTRFVFKGVNLEYFRDPGGASISTAEVKIASQIVAKMKSLGINAVRLDYTPGFVDQGSNMTNYLAMVKLLATNGIYVMPCDHSYTGNPISGYTTTSFPDFKTIIDYAKQQGITNYLIMNPYNEPYSSDDAQSWNAANEATLKYFRTTLGFKGIVVLDTTAWATTDNTSSFQTLMSYDASLLGGKSNIIFSNHWYPNYSYQSSLTLAKQYPLVIGEIGQTVSGPTDPSFVTQVFQNLISTGIPNGHNGAFPWIWWWTDGNQMTDDGLTLNTFGQLIVNNYYNKVTN